MDGVERLVENEDRLVYEADQAILATIGEDDATLEAEAAEAEEEAEFYAEQEAEAEAEAEAVAEAVAEMEER